MNHGEQDKNNNNITTYPEVNKNSLLDLAEKHYENLVEALTNNALDTSSSNPTLSSQQSLYLHSQSYLIKVINIE